MGARIGDYELIDRFAVDLRVGDPVQQGVPGVFLNGFQQLRGAGGVAGIDDAQLRPVCGRKVHDHGRYPVGLIDAANGAPGNDAVADFEVELIDFNGGARSEPEDDAGACDQQDGGNDGRPPGPGAPRRERRHAESDGTSGDVGARRRKSDHRCA